MPHHRLSHNIPGHSPVSAEIDVLRAHRAGTASAPPKREAVERDMFASLDRAARRGGIGVDIGRDGFDGDHARQPAIVWPTNDSARIDVEALVARHLGDAIRAEIKAKLDARYEGVTLTLDPHEKAKKLKEIDAKLLELERIECALIWKQIKAGDTSVFFRADANPRAVLGVA